MEELPEEVEGMILDAMQSLPSPDEPRHPAGLSEQMKAWCKMLDLAGAIQLGQKAIYIGEPGELEAMRRWNTYKDGEGLMTGDELKKRIRERRGFVDLGKYNPFGNGAERGP